MWNAGFSSAIIHIDGDAFFASCEQAVNPALRGRPVVTGQERGIVAAASYEAKKFGIARGVPLQEVRKLCPGVIILPSRMELYALFSHRMMEIVRRATPQVEEYSIDECFADITGLRRANHASYADIAAGLKRTIENELGISVSVGLSVNKVLAKVGSRWNKPSGLVVIRPREIEHFLRQTRCEKIWGIGFQTANYLKKFHILNAWDFAQQSQEWVMSHVTKPHQELWRELRGEKVHDVNAALKESYASISRTRTFKPPSKNFSEISARLSRNIEGALAKARRYDLACRRVMIFFKTQSFRFHAAEMVLSRPTSFPQDVLTLALPIMEKIFIPGTLYRATGVVLQDLQTSGRLQMNLFESPVRLEKLQRLYGAADQLAKKYGKPLVFCGTSVVKSLSPESSPRRAPWIIGQAV